ncbi:MAG: diaminopimelate decarboxylase [Alphaproteobacteria bacterium]|nr:diaminopimelate decarboxylase [Alphaproteobacteria bacterium]
MDHFTYHGGVLCAEGVKLPELAAQVGTPFYCYSTATLERHYRVFDEAFAGIPHKICYAVKSNPNLAVIATLAGCGAGADVVSEGEIRRALAAGVAPGDIVFSGVGKTRDEMAYALAQKIFQFNVESLPELEALNEVAGSLGTTAPIAVRVNPDVDAGTHAKISTGSKHNKFGIDITEAREVYARAAKMPHITVQGVSMHIGSQLTQLAPFERAFTRLVEFVATLRADGHRITTLDVGGGLGIPYGRETPPTPLDYAEVVKKVTKGVDCTLVFEPGRMIVGNAGILVTRVIYVKENAGRRFAIVDAAMNDLMRPAMYDAYHEIVTVQESTKAAAVRYDIVGPVCESSDIFAEQRELPELKAGDLIAFRTAGAYGAAMSSMYNSRLLIPEVMVRDNVFAICRPRTSYEAMLAAENLPEWQ